MTYTRSLTELKTDSMSPAEPFHSQCSISLDFLLVCPLFTSDELLGYKYNVFYKLCLIQFLSFRVGGQEEGTMNCLDIIFLSYGKSLQCNEVFICGKTAWFLNY